MNKPTLTISEILGRYYYKEWIKGELRDIGESVNGEKDELINRYLESGIIRSKNVTQLSKNLILSLRKTDLKQILRDHNLSNGNTNEELISKIFNGFTFEPYTSSINRYCDVCKSKTDQELHFDNHWKAKYFRCTICNNDFLVTKANESIVSEGTKIGNNTLDIMRYLKLHYWQIVPLFLSLLITLGIKYGWKTGLITSILATIFIVYIPFFFKEHRQGIKQP